MLEMTVGERIKKRRIELGWTQDELAERMGYKGRTSVCMAEKWGDDITTTKVMKYAEALGVSSHYLMFGYETPEEETIRKLERQEFLDLFDSVPPDVQNTVLRFLKSAKQDS